MKFKYTSQTKNGEMHYGLMDGPDKFTVARQIRDLGETPLSVESTEKTGFLAKLESVSFGSSVNLQEKMMFTKNLSGMLQAGLSLARALTILEKQTTNGSFRRILVALSEAISKGSTLSEGMKKYPAVFSTLFISMVRAGEESGSLPKSLTEIGDNLQKTYLLNKKIKGALMYPAIIFIAMLLIGTLMLIFVVPTLTKTFTDVGAELPASTQFIIWISDTLSNNTLAFITIIGAIVGGVYMLGRFESTRRMLDYIFIRLPVIGNIVKELNAARTARTLSSLLSSGVNMQKGLEITREVLQNVYYKEVVSKAMTDIEKGLPLSGIFKQKTDLYPIMVGEMIEVGEETGNLSNMMLDIANFYEGEVDAKTKDLSTIIEPVLMVFIGGAVGFFAVSMLQPMYSILDTIK